MGAPLGRMLARISWEELLAVTERWEPDYTTARRVKTPNFRGFIHLDVTI